MPRDGSGGYNRYTPGTPYVTGTTISQTVVNAEMADLGNEVANSIAKDGQTVPTANLPMGGYKHTGVANGSARTHYAAVGQVQDNAFTTGTVGGTADAITLTLSPGLSAYAAGQRFEFVATSANTGAATLNISSLGAKAIKRDVSTALDAGAIASGMTVVVIYDGTNFQLLNPATFIRTEYKIPTGSVMAYAANTAPSGWLECDGSSVLRATYADLFAVIGTTFGSVDGTHFTLPDLRGEFVRGWDHGRGVDSGRTFGSAQSADIAPHTHTYNEGLGGAGGANPAFTTGASDARSVATGSTGTTETRPRNIALMYCIKT